MTQLSARAASSPPVVTFPVPSMQPSPPLRMPAAQGPDCCSAREGRWVRPTAPPDRSGAPHSALQRSFAGFDSPRRTPLSSESCIAHPLSVCEQVGRAWGGGGLGAGHCPQTWVLHPGGGAETSTQEP